MTKKLESIVHVDVLDEVVSILVARGLAYRVSNFNNDPERRLLVAYDTMDQLKDGERGR